MKRLVRAMPPAPSYIPSGKTLLVGFPKEDSWEVRKYDRDLLPAEVRMLAHLIGVHIPFGTGLPLPKGKPMQGRY